jgi:hypothetical protein
MPMCNPHHEDYLSPSSRGARGSRGEGSGPRGRGRAKASLVTSVYLLIQGSGRLAAFRRMPSTCSPRRFASSHHEKIDITHSTRQRFGAETGGRRLLIGAFPITEFLDHIAAGYRVERQRVHVVVRHEVAAKARMIGAQPVSGRRSGDVLAAIVTGMKQQRGVWIDAHISDAEEQCAGRLAVTLDPKQFARLIVMADDRVEACELPAHAVVGGRARHRWGGEQQQQRNNYLSQRTQSFRPGVERQ